MTESTAVRHSKFAREIYEVSKKIQYIDEDNKEVIFGNQIHIWTYGKYDELESSIISIYRSKKFLGIEFKSNIICKMFIKDIKKESKYILDVEVDIDIRYFRIITEVFRLIKTPINLKINRKLLRRGKLW